MKYSFGLCRNLNKIHWDRRAWEVGYRGPPLPQQKATGRPHIRIHPSRVALLRSQFEREYNVMRHLANPYLTKEAEESYIHKYGTPAQVYQQKLKEVAQKEMPGDAKAMTENGKAKKWRANYGNLLHKHRTVEDSMFELIRRQRWD